MELKVAPLRWDALHWPEYLAELELYRDRFFKGDVNRQEIDYIRCMRWLEGRTSTERASRVRQLMDFLNAWECRTKRAIAEPLFSAWILEHAAALDALQDVHIDDPALIGELDNIVSLYQDLLSSRAPDGLHNWSDACTSKTLNQLAPSTFVMWDNKIKVYAASDYRHFMEAMHDLASRLIDESPCSDGRELETWLQGHLGYGVRKTLAKYLDEYNWHTAVGRSYKLRSTRS